MGRYLMAAIFMIAMQAQAELVIHDATVRAMPPGQPNTAAFLKLENTSKQAITLVSASTSVAKKAEFHTHVKNSQGVMSMQQVPSIEIAAGETLFFNQVATI